MTLNDPLANALSKVLNSEKKSIRQCTVKPVSTVITKIFKLMNDAHYLGEVKVVKDRKGGRIDINLLGSINKCGVIKPRFAVKVNDYEKFEKRYLPAVGFGILFVSTAKGIMTHIKAKEQNLGGRLLAYCY